MAQNGLTELKEGSNAPLRLNAGIPGGDGFPVGDEVGNEVGDSDEVGVSDGDGVSEGEDADVPSAGVR